VACSSNPEVIRRRTAVFGLISGSAGNVDRRRRFANSIRIPEQGGPAPHCLGRDISKDNGYAEFETA
jgi:hypothetical protein